MKKQAFFSLFFALYPLLCPADDVIRPSRGIATAAGTDTETPLASELQKISRAAAAPKTEILKPTRSAAPNQSDGPRTAGPQQETARTAVMPAIHGHSVKPSRSAATKSADQSDAARAAGNQTARETSAADDEPDAPRLAVDPTKARSATTRNSNSNLRKSVAEVGGRAVIGRSDIMTGSNMDEEIGGKRLTRRARAADAPAEVKGPEINDPFASKNDNIMSSSADLAECSGVYFDCMNQFCNVLDANQKQCSCSSRLTQYKATEDSLTNANNELNDVAQQIRYVGLSADEVRAILKETEAEQVMSTLSDRTQSRKMLEEIEKMIKDPTSGGSYSSGGSLDFELDFSNGDNFGDLGSLFSNNTSFSNMRGTELYGTAKSKCKSVLQRCAPKSADQGIIFGQYEIEIDKACAQYEAGMKKAIQNVKTNVRSATQMLQKARLTVLENQNIYDARGCVAALDSCMKDPMVCGDNYYKCMDPDKKTIDENGKVIPGGDVTSIKDLLNSYQATCLDYLVAGGTKPAECPDTAATNGSKIITFLKDKIGVMNDGKVLSGFCRPVLDKCRQYTYSGGKYVDNNTVIKSYLERTMTQIRAAQSNIVSDYASTCIMDVSTCYNSQITQVNSYATGMTLTPDIAKPILMGACRNVALSCAYALFPDHSLGSSGTNDCGAKNSNATTVANNCIDKLSQMFYQSLMCPANSTWNSVTTAVATDGTRSDGTAYVNSNCQCKSGYFVEKGTCSATKLSCPANSQYVDNSSNVPGTETTKGRPVAYCECNKVGVSGTTCPI